MSKDYELFKFNDLACMSWKNGLGKSHQLDIYPPNSSLSLLDFDYRISIAEIRGPNKFSLFPGFNRILTVIKGPGIKLNGNSLLKNEIINFSGDELINSILIKKDASVLDLGIIYNPNKFRVSFEILDSPKLIELSRKTSEIVYLILIEGSFKFNDLIINEFDTLKFFSLLPKIDSKNCKFCSIKISNITKDK